MEFIVIQKHRDYPKVSGLITSFGTLTVSHSPFANCQNFAINNAYLLKFIDSRGTIKQFLQQLFNLVKKRMMVIDIKESQLESIEKAMTPYSKEIIVTKYNNANKTKMAICIIHLDQDKLA